MSATLVRRRGLPLSILIFAVLVLLMVGGVGFYLFEKHMTRLNQEAAYFAQRSATAITMNWDPSQLIERATPQLRAESGSQTGQALKAAGAGLGPFNAYMGATGKVSWLSVINFVGPIAASYAAKVRTTDGMVTFQLGLIKVDGHWMIAAFHFNGLMFQPLGPGLLASHPVY
ncbi:MAG TPA: hypothetical protein VMU81_10020 [Acetobacteraceae bacterium]|nr:hypothetical protein [Acetobacteraceae bacterium]